MKFWAVRRDEDRVIVRFGKTGTIGSEIDRTLPAWQPRAARRGPEPEPEAAPAPTQAQGPGQRKAGQSTRPDERPDPLAQLAKELGAGPVPVGAS